MVYFGYARVSTVDQNTDNQLLEMRLAGFDINPKFWFVDEGISGKSCAVQRSSFKKLKSRIREGETLVVSKIDRLGRDPIDVLQTVKDLSEMGVKIIVLQFGNTDLTSQAGKLMLMMLAAVAEMELDLLRERTKIGIQRAREEGRTIGRPTKTNTHQKAQIKEDLSSGISVSAVARQYSVSRATIIGIRDN